MEGAAQVVSSHDPRSALDIVFRYVLERHARLTPNRPYITFAADGLTWTWSDTNSEANRTAQALGKFGLERGDVVSVLSDNSPALVRTLFGVTKVGGIYSPVNTAFRASLLGHVLGVASPSALVCQGEYAERLLHDDVGDLPPRVLVSGRCDRKVWKALESRTDLLDFDELIASAPTEPPPDPGIDYWDPYAIIFTSGTTGRSKGVLSPYSQLHAQVEHPMLPFTSGDDVFLGDLPMFHVGALLSFMAALLHGARWVVVPRVRIGQYLDIVRAHGVTHITVLPAIVNFLEKQPPRPDDADNPLRIVLTGSFFNNYDEWCARFGIDHGYGFFNMTEICSPLMTGLDPERRHGTGHLRPGMDAELVDEYDRPVPTGTPGELVIRPARPWEINLGYVGEPAASAAAWRNGWYHTGDLFVADESGYYSYIDRLTDAIRHRGENISSFEVEDVMGGHPAIARCAAVAVPSNDVKGENDVKACVELAPESEFDPAELIAFLADRLPYFAVPRYVEVLPRLPVTATEKVQKTALRTRGITPTTWDRLAAGVEIRR